MSGRLRLILGGVVLLLLGASTAAEEPPSPEDSPGESPAAAATQKVVESPAAPPSRAESTEAAPAGAPAGAPEASVPAATFSDGGGESPGQDSAGAAASTAPAATKAKRRTGGLIPATLVGPKAAATLLFPPNVMVGADLVIAGWVGASFELAVFPNERTVRSGTGYGGKISAWSAGLRVFPFRGSFFVGAVAGEYDVTVTQATQSTAPGGVAALDTLNVKGTYLGPQIGWKWVSNVGLFAGLNLGYGFSLSYSSEFIPAAPSPSGAQRDLEKAQKSADQILRSGVPVVTLLELGWLF